MHLSISCAILLPLGVCSALLFTSRASNAERPAYPLESEYQAPEFRELGTVPGQIRIRGLVGLGSHSHRDDAGSFATSLVSQGVVEVMTTAWVGVRTTVVASVPLPDLEDAPALFAARIGPSFHLRPYERIDVGSFVDGGFSWVDPRREASGFAPVLGTGITMDISISSYFAWHLELGVQGGIRSRSGEAQTYEVFSAASGIGLMF